MSLQYLPSLQPAEPLSGDQVATPVKSKEHTKLRISPFPKMAGCSMDLKVRRGDGSWASSPNTDGNTWYRSGTFCRHSARCKPLLSIRKISARTKRTREMYRSAHHVVQIIYSCSVSHHHTAARSKRIRSQEGGREGETHKSL